MHPGEGLDPFEQCVPRGPVRARAVRTVPKLCGADVELGNAVLGLSRRGGTGGAASAALVGEIPALPGAPGAGGTWGAGASYREDAGYYRASYHDGARYDPQDHDRRWLANGGCCYVDLDHLELCLPEVLSAWDHVAAWHAMLRVARRAMDAANSRLPEGQRIEILVNNSDRMGNSWGSHLNVLISREAWADLFHRRMHHALWLASYQASSLVFTGAGKLGSENGAPAAAFQLSQRADFFEQLIGVQTTERRPLVNMRDEPLCGRGAEGLARLHCIFFDSGLCQAACLLKVGVLQMVTAMLEARRVNPELILDDPLDAVRLWSRDLTLDARCLTAAGVPVTAIELQRRFHEQAVRFAAGGGFEGIVPRAEELLHLWGDTLDRLAARDWGALARRLDWVLRWSILRRARERRGLAWDSPELLHLDQVYASLDEREGLFWAFEPGLEQVVAGEQIERFERQPPADTRAWTRGMLLRRADPGRVEHVDWHRMRFRGRQGSWEMYRALELPDPLGGTRAEAEGHFRGERSFSELLDSLAAAQEAAAAARA